MNEKTEEITAKNKGDFRIEMPPGFRLYRCTGEWVSGKRKPVKWKISIPPRKTIRRREVLSEIQSLKKAMRIAWDIYLSECIGDQKKVQGWRYRELLRKQNGGNA